MRASILLAALILSTFAPACRYRPLSSHSADVPSNSAKTPPEPLNLSGFRKLRFSTNFQIEIKVGGPYFVEVNGTEAIENFVSVRREGDDIRFGVNEEYRYAAPVRINISLPELAELELDGTSVANVTDVSGRRLAIFTNGSTKVTAIGRITSLETQSHGDSTIDAERLEAETVHVKALGSSRTTVFATRSLNVVSAGASVVAYKGDPVIEKVTADISTVRKKF